ncbi:hypothetical protein COLO4_03206 [Corchorus olitorius]|uniref:Endonuclease/exonuclease/phosphatase n=1 Tax=Corchorus olitorius TaxID=93759 RepID=A0A1R3KZB7_9ROSI|nr:hypothetical protein COLO4_03232 [Corchorus olitorius]OMP12443.1 hypothetical protein COLO4_03206 [Corchorus olitorius]
MARTQTSKIKNFPFRKSGYRVKVPEQAIQTLLYNNVPMLFTCPSKRTANTPRITIWGSQRGIPSLLRLSSRKWDDGCPAIRTSRVQPRLDRVLSKPECRLLFPEAALSHPPRLHEDHCPILLKCEPHLVVDKSKRPFRFQAM